MFPLGYAIVEISEEILLDPMGLSNYNANIILQYTLIMNILIYNYK